MTVIKEPNISLDVDGGELHIVFHGGDVFWTMRHQVTVPVDQVRGVAVVPLQRIPKEGIRLPGSSIPGVIRAGSYGVAPDRDLWDVRTPKDVLWIEFDSGAPYRRAILQVPDPAAEALRLRPALGSFVPELAPG
ncbi:MAG: hypothetical protein JWM76_737 [Pseudonocardiales bacterium]|nr:hypothetical protein [Pseudonocardiales bacterium]